MDVADKFVFNGFAGASLIFKGPTRTRAAISSTYLAINARIRDESLSPSKNPVVVRRKLSKEIYPIITARYSY